MRTTSSISDEMKTQVLPSAASVSTSLLYFGFGSNVNTASQFIQDQYVRLCGEPPRKDNLLLVSAAQFLDKPAAEFAY